jgi:ubiquinone/menaquinone biosynthesis C-methylase UbiE
MAKKDPDFIPALRFRVLTPFYDLIQRFVVREARFMQQLIDRSDIRAGQSVLDVGCGTGTLALMVKRTHPDAKVFGLDADPEMLAIARAKSAEQALEAEFSQGFASEMPYPDRSFDRVLSTLMIHHLKTPEKKQMAHEVARVLKPGGQIHVLDFGIPRTPYSRLVGGFLRHLEEADDNIAGRLPAILKTGGLTVAETGDYQTFFGSLTFLTGQSSEVPSAFEEEVRVATSNSAGRTQRN